MSGLSMFTSVFRSSPAPPPPRLSDQPKKRNRPQLTCVPCKTRKLKCERGPPPCSMCVRRGLEAACNFLAPRPTTPAQIPSRERTRRSADQLRRLEDLVVQMGQPPTASATVCEMNSCLLQELRHDFKTDSQNFIASVRNENAQMPQNSVVAGSIIPTCYLGPIHWSAIMDNVRHAPD
jgi:Fungal Zn(2)-Cys(6) binuclear cluster domain